MSGTRDVLFINAADRDRLGLKDGQVVSLQTVFDDNHRRVKEGLRVTTYDIPEGCLGAYYPECNVLLPLAHHAEESHTPAAKTVPVRIVA